MQKSTVLKTAVSCEWVSILMQAQVGYPVRQHGLLAQVARGWVVAEPSSCESESRVMWDCAWSGLHNTPEIDCVKTPSNLIYVCRFANSFNVLIETYQRQGGGGIEFDRFESWIGTISKPWHFKKFQPPWCKIPLFSFIVHTCKSIFYGVCKPTSLAKL